MNNDHSDFCEGDSGVVLTSHIGQPVIRMSATGETKDGLEMSKKLVDVTSDDIVNELINIARNSTTSTADRIAAYDVAFKIVEGCYRIGNMTD